MRELEYRQLGSNILGIDNHSIHVIYKRPQNPSKSADTLEAAMLTKGVYYCYRNLEAKEDLRYDDE